MFLNTVSVTPIKLIMTAKISKGDIGYTASIDGIIMKMNDVNTSRILRYCAYVESKALKTNFVKRRKDEYDTNQY